MIQVSLRMVPARMVRLPLVLLDQGVSAGQRPVRAPCVAEVWQERRLTCRARGDGATRRTRVQHSMTGAWPTLDRISWRHLRRGSCPAPIIRARYAARSISSSCGSVPGRLLEFSPLSCSSLTLLVHWVWACSPPRSPCLLSLRSSVFSGRSAQFCPFHLAADRGTGRIGGCSAGEVWPVLRIRVHPSGPDLLRIWPRCRWLPPDGTRLRVSSPGRLHRAVFGLQGLPAGPPRSAIGVTTSGSRSTRPRATPSTLWTRVATAVLVLGRGERRSAVGHEQFTGGVRQAEDQAAGMLRPGRCPPRANLAPLAPAACRRHGGLHGTQTWCEMMRADAVREGSGVSRRSIVAGRGQGRR